MTRAARITKQLISLIAFLVILGGLSFVGWQSFHEPVLTPVPTPGPQAEAINVLSARIINVTGNDYDFVAKINNPNAKYGSGNADYTIRFFSLTNNVVAEKKGSFYILPGQTRYIVVSPIHLPEKAERAEILITSVEWQELDLLAQNIYLAARNLFYFELKMSGLFARGEGLINNTSDFDFNQVDVAILLFDEKDSIIAVNRTEIRTFLANTTRGFEVAWFSPFPGKVVRIEAEALTNVFENQNFIQRYQELERFQQYY